MSIVLQNNLAMSGGSSSGQGSIDLSAYRKAADQDIIDETKQEKLTPGDNITIENNVISAISKTYLPFPDDFVNDQTFEAFVQSILSSTGAGTGNAYLGGVEGDWMPWGDGGAECKVEYMRDDIAVISINSSDIYPYSWSYNTYSEDYVWKANGGVALPELPTRGHYQLECNDGVLSWVEK